MKKALQITAISALTVFLVWLFLHNANFHDVGRILEKTHLGWVAVAVALNVGTLVFRTFRWRAILHEERPPFGATFAANAIGYMLSTVLPIRAADVARPALLARRSKVRFSSALGTVLTERVLDGASILILFIYFVFRRWSEFSHNPKTGALWHYLIAPATFGACFIFAGLVGSMIGIYFFRAKVRRFHEWLGRFVPRRFRAAWMNFFDSFVETLDLADHPRPFAIVLASTVGIWFCLTAQLVASMLSLDIHLPFDSSFFITGATTIGLAAPTPGAVGGLHKVFQFVVIRFYGFDVDLSVASAVLFHLIGALPVLIIGIGLFAHEGLRWKEVTEEVKHPEE